jgi:hypothetical protein
MVRLDWSFRLFPPCPWYHELHHPGDTADQRTDIESH